MSQQQNWEQSRLQDYLLYDYWDVGSAFRVLAGLDYHKNEDSKIDRVIENVTSFPADPISRLIDDEEYTRVVREMTIQVRRLNEFWLNSNTDDYYDSPRFFIGWALSKRFKPPWLDWAIEHKLYVPNVPKQETTQEKIKTANADTIYSTKWLEVQQAAIAEFFSPRRNVDAKKEEVILWVEAKAREFKITDPNRIATSIFTIIKPEDHSPRKRRVAPQ